MIHNLKKREAWHVKAFTHFFKSSFKYKRCQRRIVGPGGMCRDYARPGLAHAEHPGYGGFSNFFGGGRGGGEPGEGADGAG